MRDGAPLVSARFWSKSLKPLVTVRNEHTVMLGIISGMMILNMVCVPLAPSTEAASSTSVGSDCMPAM